MITDVHVHVYPPEIISDWERIAGYESYFSSLARGQAHKWASADDTLRAMDSDGIAQSWITGFGFKDLGLCKVCNDYVLEAARASDGRLKALAVVPPLARGMTAEIERCASLGAIGVGEIFPDGQDFDISDINETWRFAAACYDNGMFALLHTAEPVGRDYPGKGRARPREAYQFARNHPELKIIMAHLGGGLFMYESIPEAKLALRNVWYDTAASPFVYGGEIFEMCGLSWISDKILYGSDFPLLRFHRYKTVIELSKMPEETFKRVTYLNAEKFLGRLEEALIK